MKMKLQEKANKYFNTKAGEFLYQLKPDPKKGKDQQEVESSSSHVFVSKHFSQNDIISINSLGYVNGFGQQRARYFIVNDIPIGLDEEAYGLFEQFAENLYENKEINSVLSLEFVKDCAFSWFEKQYKGQISRDDKFITFLTEKAEKEIRNYKISIPISFISIQQPFKVGNVIFEYFKTSFFDEYLAHSKAIYEKSPNFDESDFKMYEVRLRKKYQGVVFAFMNVTAEKSKSIEIVKAETEKALMVLRFLSETAFLPGIPCYFGIMGQTNLPEKYYFIFEDHFPEIQQGVDESRNYIWSISDRQLSLLKKIGLDQASDLITKENRSDLENILMTSMSLFSRSLTSRDFQDKIVYMLVAVETLLLQNESEPIQSNIGIRLAFLTKSDVEGRRRTKELIRNAYKIRSSYIHHGKTKYDMDLLQELQHSVWTAIHNALMLRGRFTTQTDILDYLEKLVLS